MRELGQVGGVKKRGEVKGEGGGMRGPGGEGRRG